ncbi:integrase catalytic subunit [Klebsiella quasivariicola]|uniref:Integrase catalytic subunit n=1 Tax=Klebsiella quasivariicola TaxID=2026240 RepID=A0A8B4TMG1_9ENTR|nr:integrase catalytic subunit [Klebsiella quasivariicola]
MKDFQGSQYGSDGQLFYRANNLVPGMSQRGNCQENAVAESFFSSLKKDNIRKRKYKLGIWPERISSITLKSSTTGPSVTAISAAFVLRPFYRSRREDRIFLLSRGLSIDHLQIGDYFFIHNIFFAFLSIFFSKSLSFLPQKIL